MTDEREHAKQRVAKLLNMTTSKGASEAEANTAAAKAAQLMAHYQIEITELQLRSTKSVKAVAQWRTYNNRVVCRSAATAIARLCDCLVWGEPNLGSMTFFGFPEDTELAVYLFNLISDSALAEAKAFRFSPIYVKGKEAGKAPAGLVNDFLHGFEERVISRIARLTYQKDQEVKAKLRDKEVTGRSLVLVKRGQIESDFAELGLRLVSRRSTVRSHSDSARSAGDQAGAKLNLNRPVEGGGKREQLT